MSAFTGYLVAHCCEQTKATCYEKIAMAAYGRKMQILTYICMMCCNIGFIGSYMVLFKSLMPYSLGLAFGRNLPSWCDESYYGQLFWCIAFMVSQKVPVHMNFRFF